ncbi:MAG TPA: hypothetical protein ENH96_01290 [Chlamydiae bacterium]|nr:hypothetical protein [Chlamydiota bacterium]
MSIVPYGNPENPRVVINPLEPLRATGPELGWKLSDMARQVLQIPNHPTSTLARVGSAIGQRTIDVSINTLAPLILVTVSERFGYLAIRSRSILGFGLNASGVISHTVQALDPRVPQFGAHVGEAFKHIYRGGIDASLYGINLIHPDAGIYLIAAEGAALLLAPNAIRSAANTVFRSVDALVDASVSRISRLFNAEEPVVRLEISAAQISRLRGAGGSASLELKQIGGHRLEVTGVSDREIEGAEDRSRFVTRRLEPSSASPRRESEEPLRIVGGASPSSRVSRALEVADLEPEPGRGVGKKSKRRDPSGSTRPFKTRRKQK